MSDTINPAAVPGHNRQPLETYLNEIIADLPARMESELADEIATTKDLAANAAEVPENIENDEEEKVASDILAQMNKHHKIVESRREGIKAPILQAGKIIDGVAKSKGQAPLEQQINRINPGMTRYKREKVERERRAREEAERLAREEAERKRLEAEAAERKRREAEAAARKAEQDRLAAEEAKRLAEQRAREADARRKQAEAEERAAAERRKVAEREAEEARARAAESTRKREREQAERAAVAAQRRADEEKAREAQAATQVAEEAERKARERANVETARAQEAEARTEKALAKGDLSDASKDAKTATKLAAAAETDAHKATKATEAKASTLSGSRGDYGGHTSLRTVWVGEFEDVTKLPVATIKVLWELISDDDKQKALNKYVAIHKGNEKRVLAGTRVYETDANTIRS